MESSTTANSTPGSEISVEAYRKTINIESQLTIHIAKRMILPAAFRYQAEIAGAINPQSQGDGATVPKVQLAPSQ